jgi:6-phosphogluconolactonase
MKLDRSIAALAAAAGLAASIAALVAQQPASKAYTMYVGTYTSGKKAASKGIYAYRYEAATGKATPLGLAAESVNPSFLAVHPNRRFLYAVNEITSYEGQSAGSISAFSIGGQGKLTLLNRVSSRGTDPAHLAVERTGKTLLAANYTSGSIASFPVAADGRLGEATSFFQYQGVGVDSKDRQEGPHPHEMVLSPDNRFVLMPDLGLDKVLTYRLDAARSVLTPSGAPEVKAKPGAGPRHLVFHPNGRWVYLLNEMGSSVNAYRYNSATRALEEFQSLSTLPKDFSGHNDSAEIEVHPNGKFLYASNRGHDSITVFAVDAQTGMLTPVEYVPTQGRLPRNFAIDPGGAHLLVGNQYGNRIVVFRLDQQTGKLTPAGETLDVPSPACIVFVPEM